jgi:serine/threonine-protein kinase HipA
MISNVDDHLRNHGFIYEQHKGWRLSPAYDMNPTPIEIKPRVLTTTIDLDDTTVSLQIAMKVAKDFRLTKDRALEIITEVRRAVIQWRQVASNFGLTKRECDRMASAFEYEQEKPLRYGVPPCSYSLNTLRPR